MFEDTIRILRAGMNLAEYIKESLDSGLYKIWTDAIDMVIDPKLKYSLISYLIYVEDYENCAFIKKEFEKIIINPLKLGWIL